MTCRPPPRLDRRRCLRALGGWAGGASAGWAGASSPGTGDASDAPVTLEGRLLEEANAARRSQAGIAPLAAELRLTRAARDFAGYMANTGRYGHEADGRDVAARLQSAGYAFCFGAENLAWIEAGIDDEPRVARLLMAGWMASPSHRSNLLGADWTDTGIAIATSASAGRLYAVQLFGRPAALRLDFSIENRSGDTVAYRVDERPYELRPRQIRVHQQCRPAQIVVSRPDGSPAPTSRAAGGERYVVEGPEAALVRLAQR